jgi:hypothetical protein
MSRPPVAIPQMGGMRMTALDEIQVMTGHFLLLALVLTSVYVSRIPPSTLALFRNPVYQVLGLAAVILITNQYGWIHGILAALAFSLVLARALRTINEGFSSSESLINFIPGTNIFLEDSGTDIIPENQRWFVEKVLGENPFLIREKEVKTQAVQDSSEQSMGSSRSSK